VRGIRAVVVVCGFIVCLLAGRAFSQQPDVVESLLASAQQAQARGDFESAAEFYRKAANVQPKIAELQANLGLMYYQTGKHEQAIGAFKRAIRLKPRLFVPNLFLGLEYVKLKRFTEAIPYLKQAAKEARTCRYSSLLVRPMPAAEKRASRVPRMLVRRN
jgi:tetratricopeptide (TPR) repeat protein